MSIKLWHSGAAGPARLPGHTLTLTAILWGILLLSGCGREFLVLHPAGPVAIQELRIMALAAAAMGIVIVAVLVVFGMALVRFRDHPGNHAPYTPQWEGSRRLEFILFAIPILIVAIIAVPTVRTTFRLDRVPPLKGPILINVTSLDWKWLFEYPTQHIATTNYIDVPIGRPLLFELTADSPMNTFWVPQLGGMEYATPGRVLPLWLQVNNAGRYSGRSGNFSGRGFVYMTFTVDAVSARVGFTIWIMTFKSGVS